MIAALIALLAVVNNPVNSVSYACDGATAAYTVNFPYLSSGDLVVTSTTPGGVVTTLTQVTDWAVNLSSTSSTAALMLNSPATKCPVGNTLKITRTLAVTQPQSFRAQTTYSPSVHEQAFDRAAMIAQQTVSAQAIKDAAQDLATFNVNNAVAALNTGSHAVGDTTSILAFGSSFARTLTSRFSDVKNVADYGATCNGVTDDTAALTAAITALPAGPVGGGTLLLPNGCSLLVTDQNTISKPYTRVVAYGAKITQTGALKRGLTINAAGIVIEGGWWFNTHGNTEWADAPAGSTNAIGIYLDTGCDGCKVLNARVEQWGWSGIRVFQSKNVLLQGNEVIGIGLTKPLVAHNNNNLGIELYLSGVGYPGTRVIGNYVHDLAQGYYMGFDWQDVSFIGNTARNIQGQHGFYLGGAVNLLVSSNNVDTTGENCIKEQISTDTTLDSVNDSFVGNVVNGCGGAGLILLPSQAGLTPRFKNASLVGNTVGNSSVGIDVDHTDNYNVADNAVTGSSTIGIRTRSENGSGRLAGNIVSTSQQTGIYAQARTTADLGVVEHNYVIDPAQSGLGTSDLRAAISLSTGEWIVRENVMTATNPTPITQSFNVNAAALVTLQRNRTIANKNNTLSGTLVIDGLTAVGASNGATLVANAQTTSMYVTTSSVIGTAWTFGAPINPTSDALLAYRVKNTSAGAQGAITWDPIFKKAAYTPPATLTNNTIIFRYDGVNWVQTGPQSPDMSN